MNERDSENAEWTPLPKGGLRQFAAARCAMEQRQLARRIALVMLLAAGITGGIYLQLNHTAGSANDPVHAGLACSVVLAELPQFVNGTLSAARLRQIQQHLSKCPPCESARGRLLQATASVDSAAVESQKSGMTQLAVKVSGFPQTRCLFQ